MLGWLDFDITSLSFLFAKARALELATLHQNDLLLFNQSNTFRFDSELLLLLFRFELNTNV